MNKWQKRDRKREIVTTTTWDSRFIRLNTKYMELKVVRHKIITFVDVHGRR